MNLSNDRKKSYRITDYFLISDSQICDVNHISKCFVQYDQTAKPKSKLIRCVDPEKKCLARIRAE